MLTDRILNDFMMVFVIDCGSCLIINNITGKFFGRMSTVGWPKTKEKINKFLLFQT